ncbi:hypothetical protein MNBD_GAMMA12-233 [hydrothermal vent metagenome]|uniref:Rhs-family protein n=1 Tax=hydrothermal vent metagenome TaxID=652676 RepID=A0A3B0Y1J2_9ZZZZ
MNHFIIFKGKLSDTSGNDATRAIAENDTSINVNYADDGYRLYYNLAGQRLQAIREGYTEQYTYTADNRLQNVYINDVLRAERLYDNIGNLMKKNQLILISLTIGFDFEKRFLLILSLNISRLKDKNFYEKWR